MEEILMINGHAASADYRCPAFLRLLSLCRPLTNSYSELRAHTRGLLERRGDQQKYTRFEMELAGMEETARRNVESGCWSKAEAEEKVASFVWRKALEASENAAGYIASRTRRRRLFLAYLEGERVHDEGNISEEKNEIERQLIQQLDAFLPGTDRNQLPIFTPTQ